MLRAARALLSAPCSYSRSARHLHSSVSTRHILFRAQTPRVPVTLCLRPIERSVFSPNALHVRKFSSNPQMSSQEKARQLYKWWTSREPIYNRYSREWWIDWAIKFVVFGITGSSAMYFVRPLLGSLFGLHGTMLEGPWSYRVASVLFVTPIYSMILLFIGTLAGKQHYFLMVVRRMWSRLLPFLFKKKNDGA